jgi:hypothetical protein
MQLEHKQSVSMIVFYLSRNVFYYFYICSWLIIFSSIMESIARNGFEEWMLLLENECCLILC